MIPNLREVTDRASKFAAPCVQKIENGELVVFNEECIGYEQDREAREAFARSVWEECVATMAAELERLEQRANEAVESVVHQSAEKLEWRPVSVEPRREDADVDGFVVVLTANLLLGIEKWDRVFRSNVKWWRPVSAPVISPEEESRAEFEAEARKCHWPLHRNPSGSYVEGSTQCGWIAWQAARKPKV